jgi:streptogramin lyase
VPAVLAAFIAALVLTLLPSSAGAATLASIELQPGSAVQEVAVDAAGGAWLTGISVTGRPALFEVAPGGAVTRHDLESPALAPGTVKPEGILLGQDGLLYACVPADDGANRRAAIVQVDPAGGALLKVFPLTTAAGQGDGCWDLTDGAAGSGRIYFSGRSSSRVGYVTPATGDVRDVAIPGGRQRPIGITLGPDGRVWFTLYDTDAVANVTQDLADFHRIDLAPGAGPRDITPWTDGALWVTEQLGSALTRVTVDGVVTRTPLGPDVRPNRMLAAPDGNLWFSGGGAKVARFTPAGALALYALPAGSDPKGLAVGPGPTLWLAGEGSGVLYGLPLDLAPTASVVSATAPAAGRATIDVDVDARGAPSSLVVDLGPTAAYGTSQTLDAGTLDGPVRRTVSFEGLSPGEYHFRVRVVSAFGERVGPDRTVVVATAAGLAGSALNRPDADGDGIPDSLDCAPADAARHPGAREVPGNRVDEDCDGTAQPFPRLGITISYAFDFTSLGARFRTFRITSMPKRTSLRLTCRPPARRAAACPFKRYARAFPGGRRRLSLLKPFKGRRLAPGTRLELRVRAPGRMGAVRFFKVRSTRLQLTKRCLAPGARTPKRCGAA